MNLNWQQAIGVEQDHLVNFELAPNKSTLINQQVTSSLSLLLERAKKAGVEISIVSSFRSFERQLLIWNDKWLGYRPVYSRHGRPLNISQMSNIEKYKAIALWSALPGMSRHHWGTDFDIFATQAIEQGHQVELTAEEFSNNGVCCELANWLEQELEKLGFFRPYKQYNKGVSEEPWHISHIETSQKIFDQFPFEQCKHYLANSEIKSRDFIGEQFEHYKQQYFANICSY